MNKQSFISYVAPFLRQLCYHRKGNYWYRQIDNHICCINVQGSQWSEDDYYVELGFALYSSGQKSPTLLHWYCRHRCKGLYGEKNVLPQDLYASMHDTFDCVSSTEQIDAFLERKKAVKVASQFWF